MTAKFDGFVAELRELCLKHKVEIWIGRDGASLVVSDLACGPARPFGEDDLMDDTDPEGEDDLMDDTDREDN